MDVMDAVNLLKKYELLEKAERECLQKKIDKSPYDMVGHHNIYCNCLNSKWKELRDKKQQLQKIKCKEWDNIPQKSKPIHDACEFAQYTISNYCKTICKFYKDEIEVIENAMKELNEAKSVLKKAAETDFYLK